MNKSVAGLLSLLQVSNANLNSPFSIFTLCLIELVGRASPLFIDHDSEEQQSSNYSRFNPIHNVFKFSQETICEFIITYPFTSVSSKKSMYRDICELALIKKGSLVILKFHKDSLDSQQGIEGGEQRKVQTLTSNVLAHPPYWIELLVDRGILEINQRSNEYKAASFCVNFLGWSR